MRHEDKIKIYNQLPGIWCEIDHQSKFSYVNQEYANLVGVKKSNYLINKTVADLPCNVSTFAETIWKEDKSVLSSQSEQQFLNIVQLADNNWNVIKVIKKPIFDAHLNLKNILFQITILYDKFMKNLGVKIAHAFKYQDFSGPNDQHSFIIEKTALNKISKKEQECLFFLLQGKTYKEIAAIQFVSHRTIIDHIEHLKIKFNCHSKSELISKAIALGFNNQIPASLFTKQVSLAL